MKCLWDLALLCDVSNHVNYLNTKREGQQKLISYMFGDVRAFRMKLKLFWKQLENVNLCHVSSRDLLHKDESVSVLFQCVRAVEMTESLAENFKTRFNDFRSHATNIRIFENPFSVKFVMLQGNCILD
jgi:hypothetical protein